MKQLTLGELIEVLKNADQTAVVRNGFNHPHSYRGYYERLCFEPAETVKVSDMYAMACDCVGNTYAGWKGGEYTMGLDTLIHINEEGRSDWGGMEAEFDPDALTDVRIEDMLKDTLNRTDKLLYI